VWRRTIAAQPDCAAASPRCAAPTRGGRRRRSAVAWLIAIASLCPLASLCAAAAEPRYVDYLYIEANEGDSSGGHVALRLGPDTFHFQQESGGLIRMRRDDAEIFAFRYAMLGNRPIHETRIAVAGDTYDLLLDTFTRRLLVQAAQFERLDALQADVDLLRLWQRRAATPDPSVALPIRAAGLFQLDPVAAQSLVPGSTALAAVGARLAAAHGEAFVAMRIEALRAELAAWQPRAAREPAPALAPDVYPRFAPTASTELRERLEALTALHVLAAAPALRSDAYRVLSLGAPLDVRERQTMARFADQLTSDLAALAASTRSDFGYPLLLGMARLAAIELSLATGRLVLLDGFPDDAPHAPLPDDAQRTAYLDAVVAHLRPATERAHAELFGQATFREADYTHLETAANRWLEAEHARPNGAALRSAAGLLLPARPALRREQLAPPPAAAALRDELDRARAALADYYDRLAELYRYNLITHNCVSEIFAVVDAALGDESDARLGGTVHIGPTLNFIPIVSAATVDRTYAVAAQRTRPSYRQMRVAALAADEPALRVFLRESNTLTSSVYHPDPSDSAFLFFTDDTVALRPLFGAANLVTGVAASALGLATWPVDAGARLRAGLRGVVFSLPELAFVNLRKGSMAWVEPELGAP
jgi:hypothetical protein